MLIVRVTSFTCFRFIRELLKVFYYGDFRYEFIIANMLKLDGRKNEKMPKIFLFNLFFEFFYVILKFKIREGSFVNYVTL